MCTNIIRWDPADYTSFCPTNNVPAFSSPASFSPRFGHPACGLSTTCTCGRIDGWIGGLVVNGQETGGGGRAGRGRENRSCTGLTSQQNSVKVDVSPPCRVQERVVTSDRFYIEDWVFLSPRFHYFHRESYNCVAGTCARTAKRKGNVNYVRCFVNSTTLLWRPLGVFQVPAELRN